MVEKIVVSRDEVLHYSWIDHTWVYVHYTKNPITKNPIFSSFVEMLMKRGIKEIIGQDFGNMTMEDGYVFIRYATDEIIEIIKKACAWILTRNLTVKDPESPKGKFFLENREAILSFFEETKDMLEKETYKYYFQRVDGRD